MTAVCSKTISGNIGIATIDSPPVNALSLAVRRSLDDVLADLMADDAIEAIVLTCAGRTFSAGADISEFGKPRQSPTLHDLINRMDGSPKPVVAAIHGTALGGGLEVAMSCHYRIAVPSAKMGLPEVHLGILPGGGGTQRLPRIVGVEQALDMMTSGKPVPAQKALEIGLVDRLAEEGQLVEDAVAYAQSIVADGAATPRVRDRQEKVVAARDNPALFDEFLAAKGRAFRGFKAPGHIVEAVKAAVNLPFDEGMKREAELFNELEASTESAAQRHVFFAEREMAKIPDIGKDVAPLPIKSVGVIGAGTMGGGITMNFLNAGIPVTLVELKQEALDRGIANIRKTYEGMVKRGRMSEGQLEGAMGLITPALTLDALGEVDLVIEAVFESMAVKQDVFGKLDAICKQGAILASNTSYLDLNEIAAITSRPEWVIGLHFFSPAHIMPLLEVVRGEKTSKQVVATGMALAKKLRKKGILAGVCKGFIANRLMLPYIEQSGALTLEGPTPAEIDKALYDFGFGVGPFQMMDMVGLDIGAAEAEGRSLAADLVAKDRYGQKKNGGFYDYDEKRRPTPSPVAQEVIETFAAETGVERTGPKPAEYIVARLLYPVVNEGARILDEGIALRASDIDMAAILGYNWPVYTGGPMFWADTVGLPTIVAGLKEMGFEPAPLLEKLAQSGGAFSR